MLKKFIRKSILIVAVATTFYSQAYAANDYKIENQPQVIEQVVQLDQRGILKQKPNGYLYLEVSPEFIANALPLLDVQGKIVPPRHYTSKNGIGAHISVIYENELIENEIWEIEELGQEYSFQVKELRTVKLQKDNKMRKLWLIAVEAPALENLRVKYGLKPYLKGHDFHITIGNQVPGVNKAVQMILSIEVEDECNTDEAA